MKKQILIVGLILVSAISFGQKKEIKKAEKAIKSGDFAEAISLLSQAEGLISNADTELKTQFYLAKTKAYLGDAGDDFGKLKTASEAFLKAKELDSKGNFESEINVDSQNLRAALVNSAIADQNIKNYENASDKLFTSYSISKKDTSDLYYAAGNAVNGKDYETALKYYKQLLDLDYTGITTEYFASDMETGEIVVFANENDRNTQILTGGYTSPGDRMTSSNRGNILRNMTLIYVSQGKSEKASDLMTRARKENPDDIALMNAEANMYYKAGDMVKYKEIINEVISKDPDNPELYYNLGVASKMNGEDDDAKKFYGKALELKPDYPEALINMADLLLSKEGKIVEEMNSLGTSTADYNRYDELKEEKNNIYIEALPYLETAAKLRKNNLELTRTLMNIYSLLGEDVKYKEMKSRLEEEEGGE